MALVSVFAAAVRRQAQLPASVLDADILAAGDGELASILLPLLRKMRQDYGVRETTVTATNGRAAIPSRAIVSSLRHVQLVTGNNAQQLALMQLEQDSGVSAGGLPVGYYLDGGSLVMLPRGASGTLRLRWWPSPGQMAVETDTTKVRPISGVTPLTSTVQVSTTGSLGSVVDVVSASNAHQFLALNAAPSFVPNIYTFQNTDFPWEFPPTTADYLCLPGYSPFVPVPEELFSSLVGLASGRVLQSLGYLAEASAAFDGAAERIEAAKELLMPRNEGNPQRVTGGMRAALGRSDYALGRR